MKKISWNQLFKKALVLVLALSMLVSSSGTSILAVSGTTSNTVTAETYDIAVGEKITLEVAGSKVSYKSSDSKVAAVSKTGEVTGVKEGSAIITVKVTNITFVTIAKSYIGKILQKIFPKITKSTVKYKINVKESSGPAAYTVSFDTNGGSIIDSVKVTEGTCIDSLETPAKDGFIFNGWYTDPQLENEFVFDDPITKDITLYAKWMISDLSVENDNDGIPDAFEELMGTDVNLDDTDGDGLNDNVEISQTGTDPALKDTDGDGIIDSQEDYDQDGIVNIDEINVGLDPGNSDTDSDELLDYDEIHVYHTDPLLEDSDGDGVNDGKEIEIGTDPLKFDSSFEANYTIETEETEYQPSVEINISAEQIETLEIEKNENTTYFPADMPGYLGYAYNFSIEGSFDSATISFDFSNIQLEENAEPTIYYFNEVEQTLEPLETVINGTVASATVSHFSTYILIDRHIYEKQFTSYFEDTWSTDATYKEVEIAFIIDDSGSMSWNDSSNERLAVAIDLIDHLPENSKISVVRFSNSTRILCSSTSDKEMAKSYLTTSYFSAYGGTYMYNAIHSSFSLFESTDESVLKMMVVLTDGDTADTSLHSGTITTAAANNIKIFTVGLGSSTTYFTNYLQPLSYETGGTFYYASDASGLSDIYAQIGKQIDISTDSDLDGIPDYYEDHMVAFNGKNIPLDKNNPDTDGDGLSDGEEIAVKLHYNEDHSKVMVVGKYLSNPALKDTDYDGISDKEDLYVLDNQFQGTLIGYTNYYNASYRFDLTDFFQSNIRYNQDLSVASLIFANAIYNDAGYEYTDSPKNGVGSVDNISELFDLHGFELLRDYKLSDDYSDDDVSEVGIGYQTVNYDGITKTILAVIVRGTNGSIEEWSSNFDMGNPSYWNSEDHKGFAVAKNRIEEAVDACVNELQNEGKISGQITYWITGHSRGAAISNLLAADYVDRGEEVFAYTFATPNTTTGSNTKDSQYSCIFNIVNNRDVVPQAPLSKWKYKKYGNEMNLMMSAANEKAWLKNTGSSDYNALNKSYIDYALTKLYNDVSRSVNDYYAYSIQQLIDDDQYSSLTTRAKNYCNIRERIGFFGNHAGYILEPSTAFVIQIILDTWRDGQEEELNQFMVELLLNSKYTGVLLILLGDLISDYETKIVIPSLFDNYDNLEQLIKDLPKHLDETLVGDGHAPATYYELIN